MTLARMIPSVLTGVPAVVGMTAIPYGAPNFPEPHFDVIFFAELPWILDEASGLSD